MPRFQSIDQNGSPMVGATLYTYKNKTTTPHPTWKDKDQTTYNTNPIVLDARGEAVVWLDPEQVYTFVLRDWLGALVWSQDDVAGGASQIDLAAPDGSSMVGFIQAGAGAVARTSRDKMREVVSVKDFGAVGDGVTDDTEAIRMANSAASTLGVTLVFPSGLYRTTSSIEITAQYSTNWVAQGYVRIRLDTESLTEPLLDLTSLSTHSRFEGFIFDAVTPGAGIGLRISGYPHPGGGMSPNWKNKFYGCRWNSFNVGVSFTTDGDVLDQSEMNWGSENAFYSCKFRNCRTAILNENMFSLNNTFYQTDFENDEPGELFDIIVDSTGCGININDASIIGKGRWYTWNRPAGATGLFAQSVLTLTNIKAECRSGHIGQLIYQDPSGVYTGNVNVAVICKNLTIDTFTQDIDLIYFAGKARAEFDVINIVNGRAAIRNFPVAGITGSNTAGALSSVKVTRSSLVKSVIDLASIYGATNARFPANILIDNSYGKNSLGTMQFDSDSFAVYTADGTVVETLGYGLVNPTIKRILWNDPQATAGFQARRIILPKGARLLKLIAWKQPVRYANDLVVSLFLVKDKADWVDPSSFDPNTDTIQKVAEIPSTQNKAGYFEQPVVLTANNIGNDMETGKGTGWTEGRIYIGISSGGSSNFSGFVGVEYI